VRRSSPNRSPPSACRPPHLRAPHISLRSPQLLHFRQTLALSAADHRDALQQCGWSLGEYEAGGSTRRRPLPTGGPQRGARDQYGRLAARSQAGTAAEPSPSDQPLTLWDKRTEHVATVQERLNAFFEDTPAGIHLTVDGAFGPLTQQAVEQFQIERELAPCLGSVGPKTWRELHRADLGRSRLAPRGVAAPFGGFE